MFYLNGLYNNVLKTFIVQFSLSSIKAHLAVHLSGRCINRTAESRAVW